MPGSYTVESVLADAALETLKRAYHGKETQDVGTLILEAYETIAKLKQAIIVASSADDLAYDPYELSDSNSAV
jgi:ABC-type enterochelin transport system substrate-binding protein